MNTNHSPSAESRLAAGYLLWTACGAGIQLPDFIRAPWLITSPIHHAQVSELEYAVATFRRTRDEEQAKAREELDALRRSRRRRPENLPPGFEEASRQDDEQELQMRAERCCQPIFGEMIPTYDKLLQALQHSRYRSTAVIDAGAGRSAILEGKTHTAVRHFTVDPVLRLLMTDYCETQVRVANGSMLHYAPVGRRGFFATTQVNDMQRARHNLSEFSGAVVGQAVLLPGAEGRVIYRREQFTKALESVHTRALENPIQVEFSAAWDGWFARMPELDVTAHVKASIARKQCITSWRSLRSLVVGVMAAERALRNPDSSIILFEEKDIEEASKLLEVAALLSYDVERTQATRDACAERAENAHEALRSTWEATVNENVADWLNSLKEALQQGPISRRQLTRGQDKVLTRAQLDAVLTRMSGVVWQDENNIVQLRSSASTIGDPVVGHAFTRMAEVVRDKIDNDESPWIYCDSEEFAPFAPVWQAVVTYANGAALCCRVGPEKRKAAVILRDRHGWIAQWRHFPAVVAKADESNAPYQDSPHET